MKKKMGQYYGIKWVGFKKYGKLVFCVFKWIDGFMDKYVESGFKIMLEFLKVLWQDVFEGLSLRENYVLEL